MTHTMDALVRDCRTEVAAGEHVTMDQLDRLIQYAQSAHHMASIAISTKAADRMSIAVAREYELQGQLVATAIGAALDKLGLTDAWRSYALSVAHHALTGEGDEPQPPSDPVISERYVQPPSHQPALEAAPCVPTTDVLRSLDDATLRDLGERLADELERRDI